MQITSKIGTFHFNDNTPLVDAKAIRDTVMGGFLVTVPNKRPIRTPQDMANYLAQWSNRASVIHFRFESHSRFPSLDFGGVTRIPEVQEA